MLCQNSGLLFPRAIFVSSFLVKTHPTIKDLQENTRVVSVKELHEHDGGVEVLSSEELKDSLKLPGERVCLSCEASC